MEKILKLLTKKVPLWLAGLAYAILLIDAISLVLIYFYPEIWVNFIMSLARV